MALKKIKPGSPNIYLGHTIGDNDLARLGHVNDIVSKYRKTFELDVPALGDTLRIIPNHVETVVHFKGPLINSFTINVLIDPRMSVNLEPGDKLIIFIQGNGATISFTGAIDLTKCGASTFSYSASSPVCLLLLYNGTKFVGVDIC